MARNDAWQSPTLPQPWSSVSIVGTFKDGDETHKCQFVVPGDVSNGGCNLVQGAVQSNILTLQTH